MKTNQKTLAILVSVLIVSSLLSTIGGAYATETILSMPDDGLTSTADSSNVTRMGAWVDEVIITAEPDPEQAVLKLGEGAIDLYASNEIDHVLLEDILAHPEIDYALSYGQIQDLRFNTYRNPHTKAPFFEDGRLNPFAIPEIREAMNWLIDREYIVEEYLGGMGAPQWAVLPAGSSDHGFYYDIVGDIEMVYAYSFSNAKAVFDTQMPLMGATWDSSGELWYYGGEPVEIIVVIRSDLPPFPEAGHYVADQLEALGFDVTRLVKPREEAMAIWWDGDPADGLFHVATGGWGTLWTPRDWGGSFFYLYTHRFWGSPLWAILEEQLEEFPDLDEAAQRLRFKDFTYMDERRALFSTALIEAMEFSNCIWMSERYRAHTYRHNVALAADRVRNILSQAWPHTVHFHDEGEPVIGGTLNVALPSLLSGPWNPVRGSPGIAAWDLFPTVRALGDAGVLVDPRDGLRHPHRIESAVVTAWDQLPVRVSLPWVTLEEVTDAIPVPNDAWVDWDAENQVFVTAAQKKSVDPDWDQTALVRSVVVYPHDIYDVPLHDGSSLSLGDFLMGMIMTFDQGKPESPVYDASYEARLSWFLDAFKGVEIIHDGLGTEPLTIATYSDLWYLDAEWNVMTWFPNYDYNCQWTGFWHMITVGWLAEAAGDLAFSPGKASDLGIPHMDYTRGPSLPILEYWMDWATTEGFIPYEPTLGHYINPAEIAERWANLQGWYAEMGHLWVSNGPFYLHSLTQDPPEVILKRFEDYPDPADRWLFLLSCALNVASTEGGSVVYTGEADALTIITTEGGSVRSPGEGAFSFDPDTVVALVAEPEEGYEFVNWTGYVWTVADRNSPSTTITIQDHYYVTANFAEIPSEEIPSRCFIATAAYGTPMAKEIQILRDFRDVYLLTSSLGIALVDLYYRVSPPTARFIDDHPALKPIVRAALMPAVAMSSIVVNTSPAEKAALVGLVALVVGLVALVVVLVLFLSRKRRDRTLMGT